MTYSIVARDPATGEMGVAVQSHYFGVGRVVPWAQAGVGAVATQSIVNVSYGPDGLQRMSRGESAPDALAALVAEDPGAPRRQVAMIDAAGRVDVHTGAACIQAAGHLTASAVAVQANLVESPAVWESMLAAYDEAAGDLAHRLCAALVAAEAHGGDIRGRQSAAMLVVRAEPTGDLARDRVIDLRVDDSGDPLGDLARLLANVDALGALSALLETDGLIFGPFAASTDVVDAALQQFADAQRVLGDANREPTVWRGLLLARSGRDAEAAQAFRLAAASEHRVPLLVRRLAAAGAWVRPPAELEALIT